MSARNHHSAPPSKRQSIWKHQDSVTDFLNAKPDVSTQLRNLRKNKNDILDELLLLYGVKSYKFFNFGKMTSTRFSEAEPRIGTAWLCNNEAFRQMYSISVVYPHRRTIRTSNYTFSLPSSSSTSSRESPSTSSRESPSTTLPATFSSVAVTSTKGTRASYR